jgi:hypothetical protein
MQDSFEEIIRLIFLFAITIVFNMSYRLSVLLWL